MVNPKDHSHRIYEQILSSLNERSERPDFDISTVESEYEALCVYQGHGWAGWNAHKDADIEGQIDAYEVFLYRMKSRKNTG